MLIQNVIWLDNIIEKVQRKHHVECNEVTEVLQNKPTFRFVEKSHYPGENVYAAMGQSFNGRYLIVFFIYKKNHRALILTARDMTRNERKYYEKT